MWADSWVWIWGSAIGSRLFVAKSHSTCVYAPRHVDKGDTSPCVWLWPEWDLLDLLGDFFVGVFSCCLFWFCFVAYRNVLWLRYEYDTTDVLRYAVSSTRLYMCGYTFYRIAWGVCARILKTAILVSSMRILASLTLLSLYFTILALFCVF